MGRAIQAAVLALLAASGCALAPPQTLDPPAAWVARLGGPADAAHLWRVEAAAGRLVAGSTRRLGPFLVAAHDRIGAWSWSDGTVVVTAKLLDALTDDDLAAVLAHELGHLELDARAGRRALAETRGRLAGELAADRAGGGILARCGMESALMARMLRHVAAAEGPHTPAGRGALERAARLEQPTIE